MSEHHFTYFKVENFKRFESFEMDNIGQFNLIVGDNNVGKTSVLEALMFDEDLTKHCDLLKYNLFHNRNYNQIKESYFLEYVNKGKIINNIVELIFSFKIKGSDLLATIVEMKIGGAISQQIIAENGDRYQSKIENDINILPSNSEIPLNLIPFNLSYDHQLSEVYAKNIQRNIPLRKRLILDLSILVPNLKDFDIDIINGNTIILVQEGVDYTIPLPSLGDGSIKLFRLLMEIILNKNGRLMIDEIDTGIHHKKLLPVWRTILKSASNNNVQLYATTHSAECLKFFRDVFLEEDMQDLQEKARVFRLVEHKDKQVSAYCYNFEEFDHAIENENELR